MCRFGYAKGAYQESSDVAYVAKVNVDANFAKLMEALLCEGTSPAITSHDEQILNHLRHSRRIDEPYSPKLYHHPAPTALPFRRAWACGARSGRAGKTSVPQRIEHIRACGTVEEGPAGRHATRHDQFAMWASLFEQRWSISGGRRGPGVNGHTSGVRFAPCFCSRGSVLRGRGPITRQSAA